MFLKRNTDTLTFGKQITHFAMIPFLLKYSPVESWIIFIDPSLYENMMTVSWMPTSWQELRVHFSTLFFFPFFHFICISPSRNVRLRGVRSPDWCYKATGYQMWIESRSPWLWSLREDSCGIQLNSCLSWYQVTCVATFQTEFISWSRFALKTGSFTIHLTYGKKSTNILLEKSNMLPECQLHANIHQTCLEILSQYLLHHWSSICLSSSPIKSDVMGWNYGKKIAQAWCHADWVLVLSGIAS